MKIKKVLKTISLIAAGIFIPWLFFAVVFGIPMLGFLWISDLVGGTQNLLFIVLIITLFVAGYWRDEAKKYKEQLKYYRGEKYIE